MSENGKTIEIGKNNKQVEFEKYASAGTGQLAGKEFRIAEYKHTRGKPNRNSKQTDIGTDGKVDYYTIKTVESFNVPPRKGEAPEPICHFFVTKAIGNQIERELADESIRTQFEGGASLGPVKVAKKPNTDKTKNDYWALVFPHEEIYKTI